MKTYCLPLAAACVLILTSPLIAGDVVTVHVASGRQFRGEVDPQTDAATLVLRIGKPQLFVRRPIAWEKIEAIAAKEKKYSVDEFRKQIVAPEWRWAGERPTEETATLQAEVASIRQVASWEPDMPQEAPLPSVVAVHIDAYVANWDLDTEVDGLVVHVYPLDATGQTVPALGTLQVNLIGEGFTNRVHGNPFPLLGQWSQVVNPQDVGTEGAVFRLPFTWVHPDFSAKWSVGSFGMVHARLAVGGQGIFEDTAAFTRIRPFSPIRDRMQQQRGHRFAPVELTSFPYR